MKRYSLTIDRETRTKIYRVLGLIGLSLIILYVCVLAFGRYIEGMITFSGMYVSTIEHQNLPLPENTLRVHDIHLTYREERVHGIYIDSNEKQTIYYFHGNGGDVSYYYADIKRLQSMGYNILVLEYPGYGRSGGFPHVSEILSHADVLFEYAKREFDIIESETYLYGYSIGTGVALEYAIGRNFPKIVLEAPYLSRYDLARENYGIAIQKLFFVPNSLISSQNITKNNAKVFIVHGAKDQLISIRQGKALAKISRKAETYFLDVPHEDHFGLLQDDLVYEKIQNFLAPEREVPFYDKINKEDLDRFLLESRLKKLDVETDESLTKYVDPGVAYTDIRYKAEDMRKLDGDYIIDTKGNAMLREVAASEFESLAKAYFEHSGEEVVVVSTYRSYDYQAGIKARGCPDSLCAKAGHSEHQGGLAIDVWSASSVERWNNDPNLQRRYEWFRDNAHRFGFHQSYQKGIDIDGYHREPWHWRYLGIELASHLKNQNMTLAEWYREL